MEQLIQKLEACERAMFALSHALRHQPDPSVLTDSRNGIVESIARAKAAVAAVAAEMERLT